MRVVERFFDSVLHIQPTVHRDDRGFFVEAWSDAGAEAIGIAERFIQDNQSLSRVAGTIRGMHMQEAPFAQAKLVRVVRGRVVDVFVDLRPGSPTWGRHDRVVLDADEANSVLVPAGFAHGFCTLVPDTVVTYKVSAPYSPAHERGILWCDPELGIEWPVPAEEAVLSPRDRTLPPLSDFVGAARKAQ